MKKTVAILGGYGVFGQKIATALAHDDAVDVIIVGRDANQAHAFAQTIGARACVLDMATDLSRLFDQHHPFLIINCIGPFQQCDYTIAKACIDRQVHYIDLADARDYVAQFSTLDTSAKAHNTVAITGASTVPAISSAILDHFLATEFQEIHTLDYGITPGNRAPRGLATIAAILSYVGKPFQTLIDGHSKTVYGWQNLHRKTLPTIGRRWFSNCDIPDLAVFPERYPALKTIRFSAGLEISLLHLGLWALSGLVRLGFIKHLEHHAHLLRTISQWFYSWGTDAGGMSMHMTGLSKHGTPHERTWFILAYQGDGPNIPAAPAIILARKIIAGSVPSGARAAHGLIAQDEIFAALKSYRITDMTQP